MTNDWIKKIKICTNIQHLIKSFHFNMDKEHYVKYKSNTEKQVLRVFICIVEAKKIIPQHQALIPKNWERLGGKGEMERGESIDVGMQLDRRRITSNFL